MKLITIIFVAITLVVNTNAQGTLVDQRNDQTHPLSLTPWTLKVGDPVGQEFVPTLESLDFVEAAFYAQEGSSSPATIQVLIHDGTITGSIAGISSEMTFFASTLGSIHRFDFPTTVSLNSGQTYVMHFFYQSPQNYSIGADPAMAYPSGQMIRSGLPFDGFDLWFREGVVVPEPSSFLIYLLSAGLLTIEFWKNRQAVPRFSSYSRR